MSYKGKSYQDYETEAGNGKTERDWRLGLLGGPVGWYELASGNRNSYDSQFNNALGGQGQMYSVGNEDVYNSMSDDDFAAYNKMDPAGQKQFISQRLQDLQTKKNAQTQQDAASKKESEYEAQSNDIISKVKAFADEMNMPVDQLMQKDDFAKHLNTQTMNNAQSTAIGRGLGLGGISYANADQATKNALIGYQMQRQQAGQNALNSAYSMVGQLHGQTEDLRRYEQGLNLNLQQAQGARYNQMYQQGLSQQQNSMGMIGGIAGFAYGGPAGAAMGQQLGSSIGGASYRPYSPPAYSYPSVSGVGSSGMSNYPAGNY